MKNMKNLKLTGLVIAILFGVIGVVYASKKVPVTGGAKNITQNSAQLEAKFVSGAEFSTIGWGLASEQGYTANCGPLASTPADQSCAATNLKCGEEYAYIASQTLADKSTVIGKRRTFKTLACN